jgi:hypothetical protein
MAVAGWRTRTMLVERVRDEQPPEIRLRCPSEHFIVAVTVAVNVVGPNRRNRR